MCRFKSGIILKTRNIIADGENDSHSDLLKENNIEDTLSNAMHMFVRAELVPSNDEWWTSPEGWKFGVDQDVVPDWFKEDPNKYEIAFRNDVKNWWSKHVLIDKKIDKLSEGYYRLKKCEVKTLCKEASVMCDSSTVQKMCGRSKVQKMCGSSTVQIMYSGSTVHEMCDSSTVLNMYNGSTVQNMYDGSTVHEMYGSSTVQRMCDSSTVQVMYNISTVQEMYGSSTVQNMYGRSTVREMCDSSTVQSMRDRSTVQEMCDSSTVQEMYDRSIARNISNNKIYVSKESIDNVEVLESENKSNENNNRI